MATNRTSGSLSSHFACIEEPRHCGVLLHFAQSPDKEGLRRLGNILPAGALAAEKRQRSFESQALVKEL
jgi:hypothetical protein